VNSEHIVFRAPADPGRPAICERLGPAESAVRDLAAGFEISQPAISQHLSKLKGAGLVAGPREGRLVYDRVDPDGLRPVIGWLAHCRAFWPERVGRLTVLLKEIEA
jgi:DNA-binding transcriptional ArsR family regulator